MRITGTVKAAILSILVIAASCEVLDDDVQNHVTDRNHTYIELHEIAEILARLPLDQEHTHEVHCAVTSSSTNGYDEEYTMKDLFEEPGRGVGDSRTRTSDQWDNPLRELIRRHVESMEKSTKGLAGTPMDASTFLDALSDSDIQIYWPFSENWDGTSMPIMTFDPEDGSDTNIGYRMVVDDGFRHVEEVVVDEEMAKKSPVWVVNRNSDSGYTSLEMLRREDPDWGEGGGSIIVKPEVKAPVKTLMLKDFTMHRNYDSWFAGASEFFVKAGAVEDFTAVTEAELKLYNPLVTDFMIVVKRNQIDKPQPFNAIIVSDWVSQMSHCAFMITEDDGGTRTEWKCTALVRIASKSYGVEMNLPFNSRDDIVWRGQLASRWLEENSSISGRFGDVSLTFEVVEY
ncbi:MAG: hypothetical protein J6A22_03390 [Bacteroidales bacterium]|nr:hypothetical protein [Bacteroidales bacterium]